MITEMSKRNSKFQHPNSSIIPDPVREKLRQRQVQYLLLVIVQLNPCLSDPKSHVLFTKSYFVLHVFILNYK